MTGTSTSFSSSSVVRTSLTSTSTTTTGLLIAGTSDIEPISTSPGGKSVSSDNQDGDKGPKGSSSEKQGGLHPGAIVGIVLGALLLMGIVCQLWMRRVSAYADTSNV